MRETSLPRPGILCGAATGKGKTIATAEKCHTCGVSIHRAGALYLAEDGCATGGPILHRHAPQEAASDDEAGTQLAYAQVLAHFGLNPYRSEHSDLSDHAWRDRWPVTWFQTYVAELVVQRHAAQGANAFGLQQRKPSSQ